MLYSEIKKDAEKINLEDRRYSETFRVWNGIGNSSGETKNDYRLVNITRDGKINEIWISVNKIEEEVIEKLFKKELTIDDYGFIQCQRKNIDKAKIAYWLLDYRNKEVA